MKLVAVVGNLQLDMSCTDVHRFYCQRAVTHSSCECRRGTSDEACGGQLQQRRICIRTFSGRQVGVQRDAGMPHGGVYEIQGVSHDVVDSDAFFTSFARRYEIPDSSELNGCTLIRVRNDCGGTFYLRRQIRITNPVN